MSGPITEGKWNQGKGKVKETWGEVTDDEFTETEGRIDQLAGKIQEKYGAAKEDVQRQLDEWFGDDDDDKRA